MNVAEWEEAFSGCTDFFQKSNTSPIVNCQVEIACTALGKTLAN
ncbi:MAG: hypothetical protein ACYTXA_30990 [Nostoc sp.]